VYRSYLFYVLEFEKVKGLFKDDSRIVYGSPDFQEVGRFNSTQFIQTSLDKVVHFRDWEELNVIVASTNAIGFSGVCKILAANQGLNPNEGVITCTFKKHTQIVADLLLSDQFDITYKPGHALFWASYFGNSEILELLTLSSNNIDNMTIRLAAQRGFATVVKWLLDNHNLDASTNDNYAVKICAQNGFVDVLNVLLDSARVDPAAENNFALIQAYIFGHKAIVDRLLRDSRVDQSKAIRKYFEKYPVDCLVSNTKISKYDQGVGRTIVPIDPRIRKNIDQLSKIPIISKSDLQLVPYPKKGLIFNIGLETMEKILTYLLDMGDIQRFLSTCRWWRCKLNSHREIIGFFKRGLLYQDSEKLQLVYTNFPQYVLPYDIVKDGFSSIQKGSPGFDLSISKNHLLFTELYSNRVVKMSNWNDIFTIFGFSSNPAWSSCSSLIALLAEDSNMDPTQGLICCSSLGFHVGVDILLRNPLTDLTFQNYFAFFQAVRNGYTGIVGMFLSTGVDPAILDNEAICIAAEVGDVATLDMLLADPRVFPHCRNDDPIEHAAGNGNLEVVKRLLQDPRVNPERCIISAASAGQMKVLRYLVEFTEVDPTFEDNEALISACQNKKLDSVKYLIEGCGIDPAWNSNEAIATSCQYGGIDVVTYLIRHERVDPSQYENNHSIRLAAQWEHIEIVELLLTDLRVRPEADSNSAIISAVRNSDIPMLKLLLNHPWTNPADRQDEALIIAAEDGNDEIFALLLQDPRVQPSSRNNAALSFAIENQDDIIKQMILEDYRYTPSRI
jgi:ankyrin repeat protein